MRKFDGALPEGARGQFRQDWNNWFKLAQEKSAYSYCHSIYILDQISSWKIMVPRWFNICMAFIESLYFLHSCMLHFSFHFLVTSIFHVRINIYISSSIFGVAGLYIKAHMQVFTFHGHDVNNELRFINGPLPSSACLSVWDRLVRLPIQNPFNLFHLALYLGEWNLHSLFYNPHSHFIVKYFTKR